MAKLSFSYPLEMELNNHYCTDMASTLGAMMEDFRVAGLCRLHDRLIEEICKKFPDTEVSMCMSPTNGEHSERELEVTLENPDLKSVFSYYVEKGGVPNFVFRGSDYKIANQVLRSYGKKLGGFWTAGGLLGRKVKDM